VRATTRPIPLPAPVIRATFPCKSDIVFLLNKCQWGATFK
jgi:hypothetical protein